MEKDLALTLQGVPTTAPRPYHDGPDLARGGVGEGI